MPDDNSKARTLPATPSERARLVLSDNWRMVIIALIPTLATVYVSQCQVARVEEKTDQMHGLVNSVAATLAIEEKGKARAEGILQGEAAERKRQEEAKP
jgi:hypothetical protein